VDAAALVDWTTRAFVLEAQAAAERAGTGYRPSVEYHPDIVHGFCARCKNVGGMTYATAMKIPQMDRIMNGKPVKFPYPICPARLRDGTRCLGREFVPMDLKDEQRDSLEVVRQSQMNAVRVLGKEVR
jgi:hypothetical protein